MSWAIGSFVVELLSPGADVDVVKVHRGRLADVSGLPGKDVSGMFRPRRVDRVHGTPRKTHKQAV